MVNKEHVSQLTEKFFGPNQQIKEVGIELYLSIRNLPLICPHSHVDPRIFSQSDYVFDSPSELIVIPDHYLFRMLYSQGVPLESLGIPRTDGVRGISDSKKIWQIFADNFYLFRGTPSAYWLTNALRSVFEIQEPLTPENAQDIHELIEEKLSTDEFKPRNLFKKFNIEVLCTTDPITAPLNHHQKIRDSAWTSRILPTFRPDSVINLETSDWQNQIRILSDLSGVSINNYDTYIQAIEERRTYFKKMGAVATDHAVTIPYTTELTKTELDQIFQRALTGKLIRDDARRFTGHMLIELARMSIEDGLVMQVHVGAFRDHNMQIHKKFGADKGADIPVNTEFTHNLHPLLNKLGNNPKLNIILFTLDETSYARELAPLAGHYPSVKIGPPWWFHDSLNGMERFFNQIIETAGIYNTVGFNDDTRAFLSIPTRHGLWRKVSCKWVASLFVTGLININDAEDMVKELSYGLAKRAYNLQT